MLMMKNRLEPVASRDWLKDMLELGLSGYHATVVDLTPQLARLLLDKNKGNRSLNENRVLLYAEDIVAGRWAFNGEQITLSREGWMTNGQHRCEAVVLADKPVKTAIAFGLDYDTRKTTDQLRPKTAGDYAGMDGVQNAQGVAAIARMLLSQEKTGHVNSGRGITHGAVNDYINANLDRLAASASLSHSRSHKIKNVVAPAVLGYCHFVTSRISEPAAAQYYEQIITGEGLDRNDPAMAVRTRLITMGKASRGTKVEIILHGWNAFRRGQARSMTKAMGSLPELV
jgi:hypothetical protein